MQRLKLIHFVVIFLLALFGFYAIKTTYPSSIQNPNTTKMLFSDSKCHKLYKKLRYPDPNMIIVPPPREPPPELRSQFEQNGDMPIKKLWYFNNYYADAVAKSDNVPIIAKTEIEDIVKKVQAGSTYGTYGDMAIQALFNKHKDQIRGKSCVVIGTESPWIEALAYLNNASLIVTLDYTRKKYEISNMIWLHVNDYLDSRLIDGEFEQFDFAVSFSSIEHTGLGRYGDPLSPYGDVEAVQQIHCMMKPNGLFFLGLPSSSDGSSYIEYNAHRIYGTKRLELLFKGWKLLEKQKAIFENVVYLLQKQDMEPFIS